MEVEKEIIDVFEKHFSKVMDKKIILYGKGLRAKLIIDAFPNYNIIGLMDRIQNQGEALGKKVFSYEKVSQLKPDIIIIAGKEDSIPVIYERIKTFCLENQILLFDIFGRDLLFLWNIDNDVSEETIKKNILQYDVISFDIFDTLIMRKILYPDDIYEILNNRAIKMGICIPDFFQYRKQADEKNPIAIPDIYEIYNELQILTGITNLEKDILINLEIDLEKKALLPREKMVEIFNYAIANGKKVYLISDMYLPSKILSNILSELQIKGYEDILVSCEYKATKATMLFDIFKRKAHGKSYFHIGDNLNSDGLSARKKGIYSFLVKSSVSMLEISSYRKILKQIKTINERTMVGFFISRVFNNPFALDTIDSRPIVDQLSDVAYLFASPIITAFVIWILEKVKNSDFNDVLFAARDGYLIQKLYQKAQKNIDDSITQKGIYLGTSRTICAAASMKDESDIIWLAHRASNNPPHQMMSERFHLEENDIMPFDKSLYVDKTAYALAHKDAIFCKSQMIENNYLKYMSQLGLEKNKKYAFIDMISSGTSQGFLSRIVPFEMTGLYFCHYSSKSDYDSRLSKLPIMALFENNNTYNQYLWMETFLTSSKPSINSIDENGDFIYSEEIRSEEELHQIELMQHIVEMYFDSYLEFYINDIAINVNIADQLFHFMDPIYTREKSSIYSCFSLKDDFEKNKVILSRNSWKSGKALLHSQYAKKTEELEVLEWEKDIKFYLEKYSESDYEAILMKDDRWEIFYHMSSMRTSILNWYSFKKNANLLELNGEFGALTGSFCDRCEHVVTVEKSPFRAECIYQRYQFRDNLDIYVGDIENIILEEKFDYIILIGGFEYVANDIYSKKKYSDYLRKLSNLLNPDGKILLAVENRYGIRYFCGEIETHTQRPFSGINNYVDGTRGYSFTKKELVDIITESGLDKYKFYYPLPDYKLTQMIYSEEYLPKKNLKERLLSYHVNSDTLVANESDIYDDLIENNVFEFFSNSFLVEFGSENNFCKAIYATMTTDRGYQNAFATVINNDNTVQKSPIYRGGLTTIKKVYDNIQDLKEHGIQTVSHNFNGEKLEMPFIKEILLSDYLSDIVVNEPKTFKVLINQLYQCILMSSEHMPTKLNAFKCDDKSKDFGIILKKAYIDMIPLNCFYIKGDLVFFDQEFVKDNFPAKYVLFRALKYIYLFTPDIDNIVPLEELKKEYQLDDLWEIFTAEENCFVSQNRRQELYRTFYKWVWVDKNKIFKNVNKLLS